MNILLVNPPIYDFSAYDFWLKPYGLLTAAGFLAPYAQCSLFDFLDRSTTPSAQGKKLRSDAWGRGEFVFEFVEKPKPLAQIPRRYKRFGKRRADFQNWLAAQSDIDAVLIQTSMTYWYPGVREVINDVRMALPQAKIVLGGVYASLCPAHARSLGPDLVIEGANLAPLWQLLNIAPNPDSLPLWQAYPELPVGVLKLTDGCPFACTYCAVPNMYPRFTSRPLSRTVAEFDQLVALGARDIAIYDDALLHDPQHILLPFLRYVVEKHIKVNFHTPNALHTRLITPESAAMMVEAGFKTFYLGFESAEQKFHAATGAKILPDHFRQAVRILLQAGVPARNIIAYIIAGHPSMEIQRIEDSMRLAADSGVRHMLAEFSPIPNTPDSAFASRLVDMSEPLNHNKTAWPLTFLGAQKVNAIKDLSHKLNKINPA